MSLTTKRLPAHPLTLCKSICIEVKHDSIKTQNVSSVLKFAEIFASSAQNAWNARGSVSLSISGYCSDSRELWEIPEVRAYVMKLTTAWPSWMFFMDESLQSLTTCFMCLCEVTRTDDPKMNRVVGLPSDVLANGFGGIQQICDEYKFGDEMCIDICYQVATYLGLSIDEMDTTFVEAEAMGSVV